MTNTCLWGLNCLVEGLDIAVSLYGDGGRDALCEYTCPVYGYVVACMHGPDMCNKGLRNTSDDRVLTFEGANHEDER